ncbi:putative prefoldin subunit 5 [Taenia crassiceps]|uniref:Prefoldin subunit 5 n=1 Tax=Taenia crassiceps TaxID=6207 RepID=A0ABR4Q228_9CEST
MPPFSSFECFKNKDKNTLIPLTSTLCVPGKLVNPARVLVDIGTGYFVEMEVEDANKHFTKRIEFIEKQIEKVTPVLAQKTQEHRAIVGVLEAKAKAFMKAQGYLFLCTVICVNNDFSFDFVGNNSF